MNNFELELYDMKSANACAIAIPISVLGLSDLARQHGSYLSKVDSLKNITSQQQLVERAILISNPGELKFTETACQARRDKRDSLKLTREQRDSLHERKQSREKSIYSFPAKIGPRTERCPCKILAGRTFWCPCNNFWNAKSSGYRLGMGFSYVERNRERVRCCTTVYRNFYISR